MKLFKCAACGQLVYFENTFCGNCGTALGFDPVTLEMVAIDNNGRSIDKKEKDLKSYHYCLNHQYGVCNWLIETGNNENFCFACRLNHIIPDLSNVDYLQRWKAIEAAKHRLVYSLKRMHLPVKSKADDEDKGLCFEFMSNDGNTEEEMVYTGHDHGTITINIMEADTIEREMMRKSMHENYRTLLGHFRHEIGHYYWDILIDNTDRIEEFRKAFGDERMDYGEAIKRYYQQGALPDWQNFFISAYATSHSWEDWAETWSHYMHITDTLETAYSFGLSVDPLKKSSAELKATINTDPYNIKNFDEVFRLWLPLTFAMNSLNRSMGQHDTYPFVVSAPVKEKLAFIHKLVTG